MLGAALMVLNVVGETDDGPRAGAPLVVIPLFLAVTAPVAWRRRAPIAALACALAALLFHVALFGVLTRCGVVFPTTFVLVFAAAATLEVRPALAGLAIGLALAVLVLLSDMQVDLAAAPELCGLTAAFWGVGRIVRSRSRLVRALETQTEELRQARDERARLEVATDRARLSTELDELLQRRLAALGRLAAPGPPEGDPAAAAAILVDIEREGRGTLDEMRAIVGVLRNDAGEAPTEPQPALTHLEAMLVQAKGAGARLTVEGSPRALPAGVELSAYRIVEHLLAALDDAPDVDVIVRFADDALELTVVGRGLRGSRAAIERARERATLHRGTLETTVRGGRTEAIALLPIASA
jgi:hypothetical protein